MSICSAQFRLISLGAAAFNVRQERLVHSRENGWPVHILRQDAERDEVIDKLILVLVFEMDY